MTSNNKQIVLYVFLSYIVFWLLLGLTGYLISIEVPVIVQNISKNFCAWTPTLIVLILFRKLYPNTTFKEYFRLHFKKKIKAGDFISTLFLQVLVLVLAVLAYFTFNNKPLNTISLIAASSILPVLIMDLTSGAMGEELGWRGYLQNLLQKKNTPFKAGIIVGIIWGLWHLPLMILSGYTDYELIYFCIAFMVAITSFSVVITYFYNKSKNILIAMWMHFLFNFLLKVIIIEQLDLMIYISIGYLAFAVVLCLLFKNEMWNRSFEHELKES